MPRSPESSRAYSPLKIHGKPERLVNGSVNVARRDRVADAIKQIAALRVADDVLWAILDQGVVVDLAKVARTRLEREIELVERQRAVLDDDLVDLPLLSRLVVFIEEDRDQAVAAAVNALEAKIEADRDVVAG